jgi:hypothetical protein
MAVFGSPVKFMAHEKLYFSQASPGELTQITWSGKVRHDCRAINMTEMRRL